MSGIIDDKKDCLEFAIKQLKSVAETANVPRLVTRNYGGYRLPPPPAYKSEYTQRPMPHRASNSCIGG